MGRRSDQRRSERRPGRRERARVKTHRRGQDACFVAGASLVSGRKGRKHLARWHRYAYRWMTLQRDASGWQDRVPSGGELPSPKATGRGQTASLYEADLFHQAWQHPETLARVAFDVVAFEADAERAGRFRLASMAGGPAHADAMQLVENRREDGEVFASTKRGVMAHETADEQAMRRATWDAREATLYQQADQRESARDLAWLRRHGEVR